MIGDISHNDAITRTRGVRMALGTAVPDLNQGLMEIADIDDVCSLPVGVNVDATSEYVKDGSVIIDGESLVMRSMSCYMLFCVV